MRLSIGSVYEIQTGRGLVYVQCTHQAKDGSAVMRLLDGFHGQRPSTFDTKTRFLFLLPARASAHDEFLKRVGNFNLPEESRDFPIFRNGTPGPDGKVATWWFWNGDDEWKVGSLSAEERRYPLREFWSYPLLVEKIETGWTPETDPCY